ncbi:MAG: hypothetical protein GFH27_549309n64 [Chloroflexi bacterium AL-W]|nr:hypothetical protein [Chloroflexi bacterium AL-W]
MQGTTFGQWLRHQRDQRGLTREVLAQQIGYSAALLRKLETGERRPSHQVAERLAQALTIDTAMWASFVQAARYGMAPLTLATDQTASIPVQDLDPAEPPVGYLRAPRTPLIGRNQEVAEICHCLQQERVRLLNLTGPGGVGKTRLALQVATQLQPFFLHGVWFVDLAAVHDPALVVPTLAQTVGVRGPGLGSRHDELADYLSWRRLLLVLDNLEHLLDATPQLATLLDAAPQLQIVTTSRTRLQLDGEHVYAVPPLQTSTATELPPLDTLATVPAIALFVARARAVHTDFALTESNASTIVAICNQVAGLPLGLELAAARLRLLSPAALLQRLIAHHDVLSAGVRDGPSRQQSMHATIGWSYSLLSPVEQMLFVRMGVFQGGCTLEAIEQVCGEAEQLAMLPVDGADLSPLWIPALDGLTALLDSSLVTRTVDGDSEPRFGMLVPIQSYAQERLQSHPEAAVLAARHATYYLALAEQAATELTGASQQVWLERLDVEYDNLRAALHWAIVQPHPEQALRLGNALWSFWYIRSYLQEGCHWLEQIVALEGAQAPLEYATALRSYGVLLGVQAAYADAQPYFEQSVALARQLNDHKLLAAALNGLGNVISNQGDYTSAISYFEECLTLTQISHNRLGMANTLGSLGFVSLSQGDFVQALERYEASKLIHQELGNQHGVIKALLNLGIIAWLQDDYLKAQQLLAEALQSARDLKDTSVITTCLIYLGKVALSQQDTATAQQYLWESLPSLQNSEDLYMVTSFLEGISGIFAKHGQPLLAARLWGAEAALRTALQSVRPPSETPFYEQLVAEARSQVAPTAWEAAWAAGQQLSWEEALDEAMELERLFPEQEGESES